MRYTKWLDVISPSRAIGNYLGAQVSTEPGDAEAFNYARELFPAGTTFQWSGVGPARNYTASAPASAYYVGVAATEAVAAQAAQLIANGLPAGVVAQIGDRSTNEPNWQQFIAANGYVIP